MYIELILIGGHHGLLSCSGRLEDGGVMMVMMMRIIMMASFLAPNITDVQLKLGSSASLSNWARCRESSNNFNSTSLLRGW